MKTTITVTLTDNEKRNWQDAYWGCFTRPNNRRVASTIIAMLSKGIDTDLLADGYRLMRIIEEKSGVGEVTDTDARELIMGRLEDLRDATRTPVFAPDWVDEDE